MFPRCKTVLVHLGHHCGPLLQSRRVQASGGDWQRPCFSMAELFMYDNAFAFSLRLSLVHQRYRGCMLQVAFNMMVWPPAVVCQLLNDCRRASFGWDCPWRRTMARSNLVSSDQLASAVPRWKLFVSASLYLLCGLTAELCSSIFLPSIIGVGASGPFFANCSLINTR